MMNENEADVAHRVRLEIIDGVADVRLNRAAKRNALDLAMFTVLVRTGESLKQNQEVRAVVLSGDGPDFCAGLDFESFRAMRDGEGAFPRAEPPPGTGPARSCCPSWWAVTWPRS